MNLYLKELTCLHFISVEIRLIAVETFKILHKMSPVYLQVLLFDYWIFHNRSSKIIGHEVSIDDRL